MTEKLIALVLAAVVIGCPLFGFAGVCGVSGSCCAPSEPDRGDAPSCCGSEDEACDEDPRPCRPGKPPADSPCSCFCGGAVVGKPAGDECLTRLENFGGLVTLAQGSSATDPARTSALPLSRFSRATPGRSVRCLLMSFLC